ncbi:MAG: c-type cytochrome [Anaerolineales bacterium]
MNKKQRLRRQKKRAERRRRGLWLSLFGVGLVVISVFSIGRSRQPAEPLATDDVLARGEQLFAQNCAVCHGKSGEGHAEVLEAPALNGNEHSWHHPDGQLQRTILDGGQTMPGFRGQLSNQDAAAIIRYFQVWWSASQLGSQQSMSAQDPMQQ